MWKGGTRSSKLMNSLSGCIHQGGEGREQNPGQQQRPLRLPSPVLGPGSVTLDAAQVSAHEEGPAVTRLGRRAVLGLRIKSLLRAHSLMERLDLIWAFFLPSSFFFFFSLLPPSLPFSLPPLFFLSC